MANEENRVMEGLANDTGILWGIAYLLASVIALFFIGSMIFENWRDECGH